MGASRSASAELYPLTPKMNLPTIVKESSVPHVQPGLDPKGTDVKDCQGILVQALKSLSSVMHMRKPK